MSLCSNLVDIMTLRIIVVIWHTETLATDEAIHEHARPLRGLRGSVSLSPPVCHGSPVGRLRSDLSLQSHLLRVCVGAGRVSGDGRKFLLQSVQTLFLSSKCSHLSNTSFPQRMSLKSSCAQPVAVRDLSETKQTAADAELWGWFLPCAL